MNNYQQHYKKKPVGFTDMNTGRLVRTVKHEERRKVNRADNFAKKRDVPQAQETEESRLSLSDKVIKLRRWKLEREIKKKIETQKKKPVFKVGVVHHKFYSPPISNRNNVKPVPCHPRGVYKVKHHPTPPKRITRATQKKLEAKLAGTSVTPAAAPTSRLKANRTKTLRKRLPSMTKEVNSSFAPDNYSFKPPVGLREIPLFGRFVIPNEAKVDKSSAENEVELDPKDEEDKPWPRASHPSVDIMTAQKMRNTLVRQKAVERFSSDSLMAPSRGNSSIETFTLRLSSEDESPEETDASAKPVNDAKESDLSGVKEKIDSVVANAINDPKDVEKIDEPDVAELEEIAKAIEVDTATPPRSGTPVPASFSPYIVSSRGKVSARKEQQMKMGIRRSSSDDIPMKDTVMQNLNISIEEEERTAQYFKFILQREIDRLTELCNKWEAIMNEPDLTEDAQYQINQAVGQTNLLIRKKFERFRRLVLDCETGKGEMLVQCKDLQGFWDMMYMEVKDCESRFLKLDVLKSKDWVEEQIPVASKKVTRKKAAPAMPKISAKSSARSWILAARKKKMSQAEDLIETDDIIITVKDTESKKSEGEMPLNPRDQNSRRSLGKSPPPKDQNRRRSTPKATPKKTPPSLLKKVQLSEASKSLRSPLAAMKISKMFKTPDVRLDDTISYVNSDQTPGKGILKKSEDSSDPGSCSSKSTRKVDFDDDVFLEQVPVENEVTEELQNSIDLGRALARIDTYDEDDCSDEVCDPMQNITVRKVEKQLEFEDDSFDETENTDTAESVAVVAAIPEPPAIPIIKIIPETPIRSVLETVETSSKSSRRSLRQMNKTLEASIEEEKPEETSISTRILRNRTITVVTPSNNNRRSLRSSTMDNHNISLNLSTKENSDPLRGRKKESNLEERNIVTEESASENQMKKRRSTRKSVRFNADACTACTPKPSLPMTPHTRQSRKISLLGDSTRESIVPTPNGDLMTFDSPVKLPARIRRSSFK